MNIDYDLPMRRVEFGVGTGKDNNGSPVVELAIKLPAARNVLTNNFGAFFEVEGCGHWNGISEPGVLFIVYTEAGDNVLADVGRHLARIFNQTCVLVGAAPAVLTFPAAAGGEWKS